MKFPHVLMTAAMLTMFGGTALAQETESIGQPAPNSEWTKRVYANTGINCAMPPVPIYYQGADHTQVVYWASLSRPDDVDENGTGPFVLQEAFRLAANRYNKIFEKEQYFDCHPVREITDSNADNAMLRSIEHPMQGMVYEFADSAAFRRAAEFDDEGFTWNGWGLRWLLSEEYLALRRPLDIQYFRDTDDERRTLPENIVKRMEKKYGGKTERSRLTCTIGDDYGAGRIQFFPKGGKCIAIEVIFSGDKIWSFTDVSENVNDMSMWHVDDGGEYFGIRPNMAFDGPDGLEILYFEYAPESSSFGFVTLGQGDKLMKHEIEGYYNYPE